MYFTTTSLQTKSVRLQPLAFQQETSATFQAPKITTHSYLVVFAKQPQNHWPQSRVADHHEQDDDG